MKNKNIIAVKNLIASLPIEALRNHKVVLNLIRAFGIVCWGPPVFGDDEEWKNPSMEMAGIYQTPAQLAGALIYLSKYEVNSFCEIGTFQGGNFLFISEYLKRFNPWIQCMAVDPTDYLNPEIKAVIDKEDFLSFAKTTSDEIAGRTFDLCLIDGDHSAQWVQRDWMNVGQHAKICAIHDIQETSCPAVIAFWAGLKGTGKKTIEFLHHNAPAPLQGIGIIHNRRG